MEQIKDERIDDLFVPQNCEYDLSVGDYTFKKRRVLEGALLTIPFGAVCWFLCMLFRVSIITAVVVTAISGSLGMIFGIVGHNGDDISKYIWNIVTFNRRKRITWYNGRVKKEIRCFAEESQNEEDYVIPRERLEALYHKLTNQRNIANSEENLALEEQYDNENIVFEDDIRLMEEEKKEEKKMRSRFHRKEKNDG
jgi:hypothetical protein